MRSDLQRTATHGEAPFTVHLRLDQADAIYEVPERRAESLDLYAKVVEDFPNHELAPQALYGAAFTALKLSRYEEALQSAERFLKTYATSDFRADVEYVAAECNLQLRNYDAALAQYRELISENPKHPDAGTWRLRLGLITYLKKDYHGAITVLAPIAADLKSAEARAEAFFLVGASQFHANRVADAKKSLLESVQASPHWRQADETLLLLARAEAKAGQTKPALSHALGPWSLSQGALRDPGLWDVTPSA